MAFVPQNFSLNDRGNQLDTDILHNVSGAANMTSGPTPQPVAGNNPQQAAADAQNNARVVANANRNGLQHSTLDAWNSPAGAYEGDNPTPTIKSGTKVSDALAPGQFYFGDGNDVITDENRGDVESKLFDVASYHDAKRDLQARHEAMRSSLGSYETPEQREAFSDALDRARFAAGKGAGLSNTDMKQFTPEQRKQMAAFAAMSFQNSYAKAHPEAYRQEVFGMNTPSDAEIAAKKASFFERNPGLSMTKEAQQARRAELTGRQQQVEDRDTAFQHLRDMEDIKNKGAVDLEAQKGKNAVDVANVEWGTKEQIEQAKNDAAERMRMMGVNEAEATELIRQGSVKIDLGDGKTAIIPLENYAAGMGITGNKDATGSGRVGQQQSANDLLAGFGGGEGANNILSEQNGNSGAGGAPTQGTGARAIVADRNSGTVDVNGNRVVATNNGQDAQQSGTQTGQESVSIATNNGQDAQQSGQGPKTSRTGQGVPGKGFKINRAGQAVNDETGQVMEKGKDGIWREADRKGATFDSHGVKGLGNGKVQYTKSDGTTSTLKFGDTFRTRSGKNLTLKDYDSETGYFIMSDGTVYERKGDKFLEAPFTIDKKARGDKVMPASPQGRNHGTELLDTGKRTKDGARVIQIAGGGPSFTRYEVPSGASSAQRKAIELYNIMAERMALNTWRRIQSEAANEHKTPQEYMKDINDFDEYAKEHGDPAIFSADNFGDAGRKISRDLRSGATKELGDYARIYR